MKAIIILLLFSFQPSVGVCESWFEYDLKVVLGTHTDQLSYYKKYGKNIYSGKPTRVRHINPDDICEICFNSKKAHKVFNIKDCRGRHYPNLSERIAGDCPTLNEQLYFEKYYKLSGLKKQNDLAEYKRLMILYKRYSIKYENKYKNTNKKNKTDREKYRKRFLKYKRKSLEMKKLINKLSGDK